MFAQELADEVSRIAGHGSATVKTIPSLLLALAGVFSKPIREIGEMLYQFTAPFELDSSETTATFGLEATPLSAQIDATMTAYGEPAPQVTASVA